MQKRKLPHKKENGENPFSFFMMHCLLPARAAVVEQPVEELAVVADIAGRAFARRAGVVGRRLRDAVTTGVVVSPPGVVPLPSSGVSGSGMGSSGVVCVVHMPLYIRSLYSCTVPLFVRTGSPVGIDEMRPSSSCA